MAIYKRSNVVEMVRAAKCPYWKIYESAAKKGAGNYVISADFDVPDMGINAACDDLQAKLSSLSQGRYILTAYEKNDGKRKGLDSEIELERSGGNHDSPIAGIGTTEPVSFHLEGVGKVTAENFESAIEKKMNDMLARQREADRVRALEEENRMLKREARVTETGYKKGLMAIGAVAYPHISKTPIFKEMMGAVGGVIKQISSDDEAGEDSPISGHDQPMLPGNHIEGDTADIGGTAVNQDRLFAALDRLGKNNPEVLQHLEKLGELRENDPDMYQSGLDFMG